MLKTSRSARIRQHQPGVSPSGLFRNPGLPPMKFVRLLLFAVFGLFVALFAFAFFKRSVWSAEGVLVIEAPAEKILPLVSAPRRWPEWMPWADPTDEGYQASFEGPERGAGAKMHWSAKRREGELAITAVDEQQGVRYELALDGQPGSGEIRLEPYGTQTRVRWHYTGDLGGNLIARYMISMMEHALVPTLQRGLGNLRAKVLAGG